MNKAQSLTLLRFLRSDFNAVQVQFESSSKLYTYLAPKDIEVGDAVVVDTPSRGFVVVPVVNVQSEPDLDRTGAIHYKWIVQKVDPEAYMQRLAEEEILVERLQVAERLRERKQTIHNYREALGEGTEAQRLFDSVLRDLNVVLVEEAHPVKPAKRTRRAKA